MVLTTLNAIAMEQAKSPPPQTTTTMKQLNNSMTMPAQKAKPWLQIKRAILSLLSSVMPPI